MRPRQDANPAMLAAEPTLHDAVLIGFAAREQGLVVAVGSPLQLKSPGEAQARHLARRPAGARRPAAPAGPAAHGRPRLRGPARRPRGADGSRHRRGDPRRQRRLRIATRAVATAARLDFIPICIKRFDLLMRQRDYFRPPTHALLARFRGPRFAARAAELGGLGVGAAGRLRWAP